MKAFRECGTVHAPKACTDAPLDTKGAAPSEKPPGPATESALRRLGLQRQGPTLRYDPSLAQGKREGHPKRQLRIPPRFARRDDSKDAGLKPGATLKAKADPSVAQGDLGMTAFLGAALCAGREHQTSYLASGARAERPGNLAAEPSSSSMRSS